MAARAASKTATRLEFVGPPRGLVAVGDVPEIAGQEEVTGAIAKFLDKRGRRALRYNRAGRRGAARLRLRLDPGTPPGDYEGAIGSGKGAQAFVARVLPETWVTVLAGELSFAAPLGGTGVATLALSNDGNTEISLPRALPVGLFDDDGLETAFAATYAKPVKGIDAFFETFHGRLREAHSGLLKLKVTRGHGTHPPGTSFAVEFALDVAKPLKTGHRYHGVASMGFADLPVSVSVINGAVS